MKASPLRRAERLVDPKGVSSQAMIVFGGRVKHYAAGSSSAKDLIRTRAARIRTFDLTNSRSNFSYWSWRGESGGEVS